MQVAGLDPKLDPESDHFRSGVLLLALARGERPTLGGLRALTLYPYRWISERLERAQATGLYRDGKVWHSGWDSKRDDAVAFWCDVLVLEGLLTRTAAKAEAEKSRAGRRR